MEKADMEFVFPPAAPVVLPVAGQEAVFPVRRIYCIGRNYAAHAREMGHDPDREPPFFFQKAAERPDDNRCHALSGGNSGRAFRDRDGGGAG